MGVKAFMPAHRGGMLPPARVQRHAQGERSKEEGVKIWGGEVKRREESQGAN